ncbi:Rho termination factor N-terminal domain-containing protein [Pseudohongiella sp.]|uniref:Rho termination factor-like N-terminal domain-containing protein n=1 Tax=marine sediment metagenome TaxID=412755 RepID=A0A0F9W6J2_9ZZZZ|nr:Rho termination factor N-terminal domain-containing protein [Pseudohongiella sp.]HDZ09501.1 termination factor Rho [Pseudohongiella sp.]HEA63927.1 termination factor Rho [Pseudohongiella sp.]
MPRGSKEKYTEKQKRKAEHIEESYEEKGVAPEEAEARAWATVNKQSGGGERAGGSGKHKSDKQKFRDRSDSARQAAATRQGETEQGRLENKTRDELMQEAKKRNIRGRSTMRKQELITALKSSR